MLQLVGGSLLERRRPMGPGGPEADQGAGVQVFDQPRTLTTGSWQRIAIGAGEALVPVFFGFACLTVAWILVALGMRRTA